MRTYLACMFILTGCATGTGTEGDAVTDTAANPDTTGDVVTDTDVVDTGPDTATDTATDTEADPEEDPGEEEAGSCGDGTCDEDEDACSCEADCPDVCGDGCCTHAERACTCEDDCSAVCGDGCCTHSEDACSCEGDCTATCGDGCCTHSEDACGCEGDCPAVCGDGCCTHRETEDTCPEDCSTDLPDLVVDNIRRTSTYYYVDYCNRGLVGSTSTFLISITNEDTGSSFESNPLYPFSVPGVGLCASTGGFTCGLIGDSSCSAHIPVRASVDTRDTVSETNETNNELTVTF